MIPIKINGDSSLSLQYLQTKKFKAGMLSISAVLPIDAKSTYMTSLLMSVLLRGTEKYPSLEAINRRLDYLFGTELTIRNFYRGDVQIIGFSAELVDAAYLPGGEDPTAEILEVVREILFHPLLDEKGLLQEKYVESEKKLQIDSIRSIKNNPRVYAAERMRAILYATEPCGVPIYGTEESVAAVTPADLTAHWKRLTRDLSLDCFYIGSMEGEKMLAHLENTLGSSLTLSQKAPYPRACAPIAGRHEVLYESEELAAGQSHLLLAWRSNNTLCSKGHAARMVFNELFGASPVSRLFVNVREKLSLCYSCSSAYLSYKGTLRVACDLHRDNRDAAEREILYQLSELVKGNFTEEELTAAKKSLLHYMRQLGDSPSALESFYFGRTVAGNTDTVENLYRELEQVSREDVILAAGEFELHTVYFLKGTLDEEDEDEES